MMITYSLSKRQARLFLLRHQRLVPDGLPGGKQSIYDFVRHVGCIQYDPLSIAGHNHELVLQARIPGFVPEMANELLYKDRLLIDGWDKNMSIYCTEDWPYFQRRREAAARHQHNEAMAGMITHVRAELDARGPLVTGPGEYGEDRLVLGSGKTLPGRHGEHVLLGRAIHPSPGAHPALLRLHGQAAASLNC